MTTEVARRGSWDRRRIIFGDWTWLVRDALDLLRLAFLVGTVAFAVMGRSTAVGLTAASAPDPARVHSVSRRAGIFISTLALGMAVGAGYEVVEWSSDKLLGTHLVKSIDDTGSDLLEDTCGSLAAAILVTV